MKSALVIILSLSALAMAGPAFNKNNQIDADKAQSQPQYMNTAELKQSAPVDTLKQWCFASQMGQPELTASFKKLVSLIKSAPSDAVTETAVMSERICQGAIVEKSAQAGETVAQSGADAQAHELIKDVYMDALIACETRECMQQLLKIINSQKVDTVRASYYMTRIAVTDKDSIKDEVEVKELAESFLATSGKQQQQSEAIERQKMLAVTATLAKSIKQQQQQQQQQTPSKELAEIREIAREVAKAIVERFVKPVTEADVQQYKQQKQQQQQPQLAKKIAKRSAALKALANIPGYIIKQVPEVEQALVEIAQNKDELSTVRQSAIECLGQNDKLVKQLKQIAFEQDEPTEVRVAAYRALITCVYAPTDMKKSDAEQQQQAADIVNELIKHCEDQRNQNDDTQFVLYVVSHLDNMRTSEQPELEAIKECIGTNKQQFMQIQVLCKKLKQQLGDWRKSSRNYKLEQQFNQLESGLIVEGDIVYADEQEKQQEKQQQDIDILPKLIRVNMSMPVMGETVNVIEVTVRQNNMDEQLMGAFKLIEGTKFNVDSMNKVVDSFKQSIESQSQKQQQQQQQQLGAKIAKTNKQQNVEADLCIKVDGCTVVYVSVDDFKSADKQHQRNTRSVYAGDYSFVDALIGQLKRSPVNFNRGFNLHINERLAKVLDVEANVIAGLRFESRAQGSSSDDFELVARAEPRFAFESIVGAAKMGGKKLLQRASTKTALGLRLRFKRNELVDMLVELPNKSMDIFTIESQMVEQSRDVPAWSYAYLPGSIYGAADIYGKRAQDAADVDALFYDDEAEPSAFGKAKRSILGASAGNKRPLDKLVKLVQGKQRIVAHSFETSPMLERVAGVRGKLRLVAAPRDMAVYAQCTLDKTDARMQGYRVQLAKSQSQRAAEQSQWTATLSTPGSRVDRSVQVRVGQQLGAQRTLVKLDAQTPHMGAGVQLELVHDARQYALKLDMAATRGAQWRHAFECGVQRSSQSQSGRIAATYKPFMSVESSALKRPLQMQAALSYQLSPKTVIAYELKCPTSSDFVQGKIIVDARNVNAAFQHKRQSRRDMRPTGALVAVATTDVALSSELVGQLGEHALKLNQMLDWSAAKWALQLDSTCALKNTRKTIDTVYQAQLKLDMDQQMVSVARKCAQRERDDFRFQLVSSCKSPVAHELVAELRYNGKRSANLNELVAYKHKIDFSQALSARKLDLGMQLQLTVTELELDETLKGRVQLTGDRKQRSVQCELASRDKSAKLAVDFATDSPLDAKLECVLKADRVGEHRTLVRVSRAQVSVQSRTDKHNGQTVCKVVLDARNQWDGACQLLVEVPAAGVHFALDAQLAPGKLSSVALQCKRFASKAEFSFDRMQRRIGQAKSGQWPVWKQLAYDALPFKQLKLKTDLKDLMTRDAYWLESQLNAADAIDALHATSAIDAGSAFKPSYVRASSPLYRADIEYEPRSATAKLGVFGRAKRSVDQSPYANDDSLVFANNFASNIEPIDFAGKLELANKLWAARALVNALPVSAHKLDQLKHKAVQALFEYADRRQNHKHSFGWSPSDERVNFALERACQGRAKPMRIIADLSTKLFAPTAWTGSNKYQQQQQQQQSPISKINMQSEFVDWTLDAQPFDGSRSSAAWSAVSRHPRAAFKKHDAEISYDKTHGYKATMKHHDGRDQRHELQLEAAHKPYQWSKVQVDSDKHGKAKWEHKWRKDTAKRSLAKRSVYDALDDQTDDDSLVYPNEIAFDWQAGASSHRSALNWLEPVDRVMGVRARRDTNSRQSPYAIVDYLKHVNARVQSNHKFHDDAHNYKLDFDFSPDKQQLARLNIDMLDDMMHSSTIDVAPADGLYKFNARTINKRNPNAVPDYQLSLGTKPWGVAAADKQPAFFAHSHPMLERAIDADSALARLFKQPIKLDYSDKLGRVARFDYDQSPLAKTFGQAALRQKRAALYFKDADSDIEHSTSYDFYPETLFVKPAPAFKRDHFQPLVFKTHTKYGPLALTLDSDQHACELKLASPVVAAKLTAEGHMKTGTDAKLFKLHLDNQQQTAELAKIVRQLPVVGKCQLVKKLAAELDASRFEHDTEMLVSFVDAIFKLKSQTANNNKPVMTVDAEFNKPHNKLVVKLDAKRTDAQLVLDLNTKSADFVFTCDDKRAVQHQTRVVRLNDMFYSIDSTTTYKHKPMFKLNAKISSIIFDEPQHFFAKRSHQFAANNRDQHISTFEATIFEPKPIQVIGEFDVTKNEAHLIFKDIQTKKTQETIISWNEQSETIFADSRLTAPRGEIYSAKAKINFPGLIEPYNCRSQACQSEIFYKNNISGKIWTSKLVPGEYISIDTPVGKKIINWVF